MSVYLFTFRYPHRKSHGFKSDDWVGWANWCHHLSWSNDQRTSPSKSPITHQEVWTVAQFCWKQTLSLSENWYCEMLVVTVTLSSSKYRPQMTVQGAFVQCTRVVLGPNISFAYSHYHIGPHHWTTQQLHEAHVIEFPNTMLCNFESLFCQHHCMDIFTVPCEDFFTNFYRKT